MKIGTCVLIRRKEGGALAFEKRYVVDYLPSTKMISFSDSKYGEAVYYHNIDDYEIKVIKRHC